MILLGGLSVVAVGVVVNVPEASLVKDLKVADEAFVGGCELVLLQIGAAGVHLRANLNRHFWLL